MPKPNRYTDRFAPLRTQFQARNSSLIAKWRQEEADIEAVVAALSPNLTTVNFNRQGKSYSTLFFDDVVKGMAATIDLAALQRFAALT